MDLRVEVDVNNEKEEKKNPCTRELRKGIAKAVSIQRKRQGKPNAHLTPSEITELCTEKLSEEAKSLLEESSARYDFSPRAIASTLKTARTISDISGKEEIDVQSIQEAVSFRKKNGGLEIGLG